MKVAAALAGGLAGAYAVASMHEIFKRVHPDAPRMDLLDMEALKKILKNFNAKVPGHEELFRITIAGEAIGNLAYYSLAGIGRNKQALLRGGLLGLMAGITAVVLPGPLGLSPKYSNKTTQTQVMTVSLYVIGGLVAAAVAKLVDKQLAKKEMKDKRTHRTTY